ncbi:hypothetical protein AK812_SmicGene10641 [Symbiodinium microadriaticum]|uniref:Uncharacterized protein n=1 Tax=Symbiodinium microadriaticum TaxID=2951 RepID=A0A1Q9EFC9_SYMMI|nr:hypothetical protein AK812_SmicGene10641 [Symbiodinium microadriaticum]
MHGGLQQGGSPVNARQRQLEGYFLKERLPPGVPRYLSAIGFRLFLMPIDAWKTTKQATLRLRPSVTPQGAPGILPRCGKAALELCESLPQFDFPYGKYVRNAFIGFCSAAVSDTCSNSLRVLKTTRQTSMEPVGYLESAKQIIASEGYAGLFGRELSSKPTRDETLVVFLPLCIRIRILARL